jgi:hypothetical protein
MDFGFTNDGKQMELAYAFIEAAITDGWEQYQSYPSESTERACKLKREGFVISAITRTKVGKWKFEVQLNAWGPDGLCIKLPIVYNPETFLKAETTCGICNKEVEKTFRYSFAGRACADCIPEARKKHEQPGWCD